MKEGNKPSLTMMVMCIFGFNSDEREEFLRQDVYDKLFELSKDKETMEIFHNVYFTKLIGKTYSKDIEEVLFRLGTGKIIEVKNPEYKKIEVSKEAKKNIKEYINQHYSDAVVEKMKRLAKKFRELQPVL